MKKNAFITRRKVIIYVLSCILVLGLVMGLSDPFKSDNTVHTATFGETIVMESPLPASGSPSDYDLISNLKYSAYKIHHASYFRGETNGSAVADIGFTTYTQTIHNTRIAAGNTVFAETISTSTLKKLAEQKYASDGVIVYRPSEKVSSSTRATYSDKAYIMSYEKYSQKYGTVPNQLSKYIINEKTILSVKDENAPAVAASLASSRKADGKNADSDGDGGGFDFYVPEHLVQGEDGNYRFTVTLDPEASTLYYRNEVRTLGGADQNPLFEALSATVTIDKDWNPVSVYSVEQYSIAIPVLGSLKLKCTITERFSQIGDENGVVPERDFFDPYVKSALDNPDGPSTDIPPAVVSPADYLASAFADYISGSKDLALGVNVNIAGFKLNDLKLSLNIKTKDVKAKFGKLYAHYAGDRVNIALNDINGYLPIAKLTALADNAAIRSLTGGYTLPAIDINKILGEDILGSVFAECEMTSENGVTRIHMPFTADLSSVIDGADKAQIDASIYIEDEGYKLRSISADIIALGKTFKISAEPISALKFPAIADNDLSPLIDFIPDVVTSAQSKIFGVKGDVSAQGYTLGLDGFINIENGISAQADITLKAAPQNAPAAATKLIGATATVRYAGDRLYISIGDATVGGGTDELPALVAALSDLLGIQIDSGLLDTVKAMLPRTPEAIIGSFKSLSVTDSELKLGLSYMNVPLDIKLERANGKISALAFDIEFALLGYSVDASADLAVTYPQSKTVVPPDGDILSFTELGAVIDGLKPYLQASAYAVTLDIDAPEVGRIGGNITLNTADGISASGAVTVVGQPIALTYIDGALYLGAQNVKLKANYADLGELKSPLMRALTMFVGELPDFSVATAIGMIKGVRAENGKIVLTLDVLGKAVTLTADQTTGVITVSGVAKGTVTLTPSEPVAVNTPEGEHADIAELDVTLERVLDIVAAEGITAKASAVIGGANYTADVALSFKNGLALRLSEPTLPLDVTVVGKTAYITYNEIRVKGSLDDVPALLDALDVYIPADVRDMIDGVLSILAAPPDTDGAVALALGAITKLDVANGRITASAVFEGKSVAIDAPVDLSAARIGAMGVTLDITDIAPAALEIVVPAGDYAEAGRIAAAIAPIVPLTLDRSFTFGFDVTLFGAQIAGTAQILVGNTLADTQALIEMTAGDLPVTLALTDGCIYLSVNDSVKVCETVSLAALDKLLAQIDVVAHGLREKVNAIINAILSTSLFDVINASSVYSIKDGFGATFALAFTEGSTDSLSVGFTDKAGVLSSVALNGSVFGISVDMTFDASLADGVLVGLNHTSEDLDIILTLARGTEITAVTVNAAEYLQAAAVAELIAPIADFVSPILTANSLTFDIDATAVMSKDNKQTSIKGSVAIAFKPIAVSADIYLFQGTDDSVLLSVKFTENTLYIECEQIKLKLGTDSSDSSDLVRVYNVLKGYLPDYLNSEIAKLLKIETGASMFDRLSLMIERIKQMSKAGSAADIVKILFAPLGGLNSDTTVKAFADTVKVFERDGKITASANVLSLTLNVTPVLARQDGKLYVDGADIDTNIPLVKMYVGAKVTAITPSENALTVAHPADADKYVAIADFAETVNKAVNTFTTVDKDGNITFELTDFTYDYDIFEIQTVETENGEIEQVLDAAGRPAPLVVNGVKAVAQHIDITKPASATDALVGKFVRTATTDAAGKTHVEYKLNLAAHLLIDIKTPTDGTYTKFASKTGMPITVDLYMVNNADAREAFIDYGELDTDGKLAQGERIYIDYDSLMQIVAAAMDIMGVDDGIMNELLGSYRLDIDKTVFESMKIAGLDKIKTKLNGITQAAKLAKSAYGDIKQAWNSVKTAGSTDALRAEFEQIKTLLERGLTTLKSAYALIKPAKQVTPDKPDSGATDNASDNTAETVTDGNGEATGDGETTGDENESQKPVQINGKLFKQIVTGVAFRCDASTIAADIDNAITTNTVGKANVTVTNHNDRIDRISVSGLDVNTARLNVFDAPFTAGGTVDIALPADYDKVTDNDKSTYSDFANIKHLLFDVMNTANMFEFEIGDIKNATDENSMTVRLSLGLMDAFNIKVKYNAKVSILDMGEDANPRYKTAAAIELVYKDCKALGQVAIPDCTTRLYFFDDKLCIDGTKVNYISGFLGFRTMTVDPVKVMYTVDDLVAMLNGGNDGMHKFMFEFLFYLLPLTRSYNFVAWIDMQQTIYDEAIKMVTDPSNRTIAKVFKGYSYDAASNKHALTIGLNELVGVSAFRDINLGICGANDGDDNILDNYISTLHIDTSFVGMIDVQLNAKLMNVDVYEDSDGVSKIRSSGLTLTTLNYNIQKIVTEIIPSFA